MRNQIAKSYANHCRHNYRKHRPAHTTSFFFDCKAGCGAREVEDAHYYCTDCRCKRPAILRKQCKKFLITCKISQRTRGKVRHNYYRYYSFICRKAEYKSHIITPSRPMALPNGQKNPYNTKAVSCLQYRYLQAAISALLPELLL